MKFDDLKYNLISQEKELESKLSEIFRLIKKGLENRIYEIFEKITCIDMNDNDIKLKNILGSQEEYEVVEKRILDNLKTLNNPPDKDDEQILKKQYNTEIDTKIQEYNKLKEYYTNEKLKAMKLLQNKILYESFLISEVINNYEEYISQNQINSISKQKEYFWILWNLEISKHNDIYILSIPNLYIWWYNSVLSWTLESNHLWNLIIQYYWKLNEYFEKWYHIAKKEKWLDIYYSKWKNGIYISNSIMNDEIYNP